MTTHEDDEAIRTALQTLNPAGYKFSAPGVSKIDVAPHGGAWKPLYDIEQVVTAVKTALERAEKPMEMRYCESVKCVLHPGQLYRFTVDPECDSCARMGAYHDASMSGEDPDPPPEFARPVTQPEPADRVSATDGFGNVTYWERATTLPAQAQEARTAAQPQPLSDERVIEIRKSVRSDPAQQWGDTLAFAHALLAATQPAQAQEAPGEST